MDPSALGWLKLLKPARQAASAALGRARKIAAIDARLTEVETKLDGPWPPDVCHHCGERACRLGYSGVLETSPPAIKQRWDCSACRRSEWRLAPVSK